ncbi:MAG: nuclear transport factor 2 family protein [Burkholderiaceae bacterium]
MIALDIPNLLYRYADYIDAGQFDDAASMFRYGRLIVGKRVIDRQEEMVAFWRQVIRLYDDGTPRTRHLISNPQIHLSEEGEKATCRSQWTVLQAVPGFPLQVIATGRYEDRLHLRDSTWHFEERRYLPIDLEGDLSFHLMQDPRRTT